LLYSVVTKARVPDFFRTRTKIYLFNFALFLTNLFRCLLISHLTIHRILCKVHHQMAQVLRQVRPLAWLA